MDRDLDFKRIREFNRLRNSYEQKNYNDVIKYADRYIELSEKDRTDYKDKAFFMKAKALRTLEKFDEAIIVLNEILERGYNVYAYLELFFIYYFTNNYEKALEILPILYQDENKKFHNFSLNITELVMKKQLGLDTYYKKGTNADYIYEQIVNYNETKALNHINNHIYPKTLEDIEKSKFNNIDINYLMQCVKRQLNGSKKTNINDVLEVHYFGVSNIGYDSDNVCNYVKVIICPNTLNIIGMYPVSHIDSLNKPLDLEYEYDLLFKSNQKQKTLSRIDKFNKRYNR